MRLRTALVSGMLAAAIAAPAVVPAPGGAASAAGTGSRSFLLGVSAGGDDLARVLPALDRFGNRRQAVVGAWLDKFGPQFRKAVPATLDGSLTSIWRLGYVPMLTWLVPMEDSVLAGGGYDAYLKSVAGQLRSWLSGPDRRYGTRDDRRLYLRPSPEANHVGCSYCVVGSGVVRAPDASYRRNVSTFKKSWVRFYDVLRGQRLDARHLQMVFAVNNIDAYRANTVGGAQPVADDIYPGNAYVDWVGIDGYSRGESPAHVFDPMLMRLERLTHGSRPIAVTEWGVYPTRGIGAKNHYLAAFFDWLQRRPVRMAMYWNAPDSRRDPTVEIVGAGSGCDATARYGSWRAPACSGYRAGLAHAPRVVSASPSRARRLTDRDFAGG